MIPDSVIGSMTDSDSVDLRSNRSQGTKICALCGTTKNLEEFNFKRKVKKQPYCRACQSNKSKAFYNNNQQKSITRTRANRFKNFKAVENLILDLKSKPCLDCGGTFAAVSMDFDHVRGVKVLSISYMARFGYSVANIIKEMDKCEVVCANCHRVRTRDRLKQKRSGID